MGKVSVVIPLMNEETIVDDLLVRLDRMSQGVAHDFEFILVDDGSTDGTLTKLLAWRQRDPRLTVIKLTRNWGHQNAYNAGLDGVGEADAVVLMDGDLEDPPEVIPQLLEQWEQGAEVVYTVKRRRTGSLLVRILTKAYYRLMRVAVEVKLERQSGMFSLIGRKALVQLRRFPERNKSYPNLRMFVGFKQAQVIYDRESRRHGRPRQNLGRLFQDGLNALFAFSYLPMRAMTVIGLIMVLLFSLLTVFVLFIRFSGIEFWIFQQVPGWTSLVLFLLVVSSFNIVFVGLIGEYVARIFDEVKNRPYYIVDEFYRAPAWDDVREPGAEQEPVRVGKERAGT
ncbi:MAG: glycosyltransferase [Proteobacteria bacterium]|nr:glycosyltransferase [Pseudomonadota bacterium]